MFENIFSKKEVKIIDKPLIIVDHREKNSLVISELVSLGAEIDFRQLPVADFIVKNTAIERKTVSDFLNSMINKRLERQLEELQQYDNRMIIIEGIDEQELYSDSQEGGINANAIRGFLLSIILKHRVPIIFSKDYGDTAKFIMVLAKKEESESGLRARKRVFNKKQQLQYILEGFPGIGPKTAKRLLKKYKTIKHLVLAGEEELVKEIGKKAEVFKLLDEQY